MFLVRWVCFPIKSSQIAQREHLFSMDFDDFLTIYLIFLVLKYILDGKSISQWEQHIPAIPFDKGMGCHLTVIELFYSDDNFRRIAQWVLALSVTAVAS